MPYVAPEVVQRVKQIDLLTYLKTMNLMSWCISREHLYHQNPRQFEDFQWEMDVVEPGDRGRSALDYLIKVRGYDFMQAVQTIAEQAAIQPPVSVPAEKKTEKKLILPKPYRIRRMQFLTCRTVGLIWN